jgi:hypothetical protein
MKEQLVENGGMKKYIQGVSQKSWNIFFFKRFIDNTS